MTKKSMPFLICELANSHGGKIDVLDKLIAEFAHLAYPRKGIKFQIFSANTIALNDYSWYNVYQELEIPTDTWTNLIRRASKYGQVFIDIFDSYGVKIFADNQDFISGVKLQASVLNNDEIYSALSKHDLSQKSLVLNMSGYDLNEIRRITNYFCPLTDRMILQIGFQSYPTAIKDTALNKISILKAEFPEFSFGIADHADGSTDFAELVPIYAHLVGCDYIEKHICIDRASAPYDGFSALEPEQLQCLARRLKELYRAIGNKFISKSESKYLADTLQIPILKTTIESGTRIKPQHLIYRRTSQSGISWHEINMLQKERYLIKENISAHQALTKNNFRPAESG